MVVTVPDMPEERALFHPNRSGESTLHSSNPRQRGHSTPGHRREDAVVVGDRVAGHDDLRERIARLERLSTAVSNVAKRDLHLVHGNERVQRIDYR